GCRSDVTEGLDGLLDRYAHLTVALCGVVRAERDDQPGIVRWCKPRGDLCRDPSRDLRSSLASDAKVVCGYREAARDRLGNDAAGPAQCGRVTRASDV